MRDWRRRLGACGLVAAAMSFGLAACSDQGGSPSARRDAAPAFATAGRPEDRMGPGFPPAYRAAATAAPLAPGPNDLDPVSYTKYPVPLR